jgi:hypothetical protein
MVVCGSSLLWRLVGASFPSAIMLGAVEHGNGEHELLRFTDFIDVAIGKALGKSPAYLRKSAAT